MVDENVIDLLDDEPDDGRQERSFGELNPMDEDQIQSVVKFECEKAVDFADSEFAMEREQAQRYYNGQTSIPHEEGRSAVVVTKVRDTVRQLLPSVMRIFLQSNNPVELKPKSANDVEMVQTQQETIKSIFWNSNGYNALVSAFMDSFNKRVGVVRVTLENEVVAVHSREEILSQWQIDQIEEDGMIVTDMEPIEPDDEEDYDDEDYDQLYKVTYTNRVERDKWCIDPIPPEEFIIDKYARSIDDCQIIGTYNNKRASDLIEMGFDWEDIKDLSYFTDKFHGEKYVRQGYTRDEETEDNANLDPSAQMLAVADVYMRIDMDGDGYAELRHIIAAGESQYRILLNEPANFIPFSVFRADIEPHAFFPRSINQTTQEDQDAY
jgi:hypothetical protein